MDRYAQSVALEKQYVHDVYDHIAPHFSNRHFKAWPKVRKFLEDLPPGAVVADIGCGNGRYFGINPGTFMIGCDCCAALIDIAKQHQGQGHSEVMVCDNLQLPYRDGCCDAVISIGVIHHFSTIERRVQAVQEIARLLRPGGKVMIYVWALEQKQRKFEAQDVLVPYHMQPKPTKRKEKKGQMIERDFSSASSISEDDSYLELTVPRTPSTPKSASPRPPRKKDGRSHFNWDIVESSSLPENISTTDKSQLQKLRLNKTNGTKDDDNGADIKLVKTADTDSDSPENGSSRLPIISQDCQKANCLSLLPSPSTYSAQTAVLTNLKPKTSQMFKVPDCSDCLIGEVPVAKIHLIRNPKMTMRKHYLSSQGSSISSMEDEDADDDVVSSSASTRSGKMSSESSADPAKKKMFRKHVHVNHKQIDPRNGGDVSSCKVKHHHKPHHHHHHHHHHHRSASHNTTDDTDSDSPFSNISRFLKSNFPTIFSSSSNTAKLGKSPLEKNGGTVHDKGCAYADCMSKAVHGFPNDDDYPVIEGFEVREFPQSSRKETFDEVDCDNNTSVSNGCSQKNSVAVNGNNVSHKSVEELNGYHRKVDQNGHVYEENKSGHQKSSQSKLSSKDSLQSSSHFPADCGSSFSKEFIELYMQYVDIGDADIIQAAEYNQKSRSQNGHGIHDDDFVNPTFSNDSHSKNVQEATDKMKSRPTLAVETPSTQMEVDTLNLNVPQPEQNGRHCHVTNGSDVLQSQPQYQRYYHVFKKKELTQLIEKHEPRLRVIQACYDHANWCVIAEKI